MIKPTKTKAEVRAELDAQVARFLSKGGGVEQVERGESGVTDNRNLFAKGTVFTPRETRTPLNGLVQDLEARKKRNATAKVHRRPKKRAILDDFGEPIRWVWD